MRTKLLFTTIMLALAVIVQAEKVETSTVKKVSKAFYWEQLHKADHRIALDNILIEEIIPLKGTNDDNLVYLINMNPAGFVIVSGDDIGKPVLGYSITQKLKSEMNNPGFKTWIEGYVKEIEEAIDNNSKSDEDFSHLWNKYNTTSTEGLANPVRMAEVVSPLISSLWNQDSPYNMLCPEDEEGPGDHVYAGCVATTMSQIMYYYRYPAQGFGSHTYYCPGYGTQSVNFGETTYDWEGMWDETSGSTYDTKYAIAELMHHCGVAVDMGYGNDGSGAFSAEVPYAIKTYFGYDNTAEYLLKDNGYNWTQWEDMLKEQLDAKRPVYYKGRSNEGGHAFVCDGYDDNDMFHFNFGWSGSGDGFFALTGSGAVGGYNQQQGMVRNFIPKTTSPYPYFCSGDKELTNMSGSIVDGSGPHENYETNVTCSWLIKPKSEFDEISNIIIYFKEMDLEANADFVTIYNGSSTSDEIAGQYTGTDLPDNLSINNSHALIVFESDGNESENSGFRLQYKTKGAVYCSGMANISDSEGIIDDGSEDMNHAHNAVCQYYINPPGASTVTIEFNEFDLGDEGDYIRITQINSNEVLQEFHGGDTPENVTTTGPMLVSFITNGYDAGQGFEAEYAIDIAVGQIDLFKGLLMYPNPAKEFINIYYELENQSKSSIEIIDINGRLIYKEDLENSSGIFNHIIKTENYKQGLYILNITSEQGSVRDKIMIR